MSIELSRRDFMKCSAVAALAVASGTLLTGCGGGGGTGLRPGQTYTTQNGVSVKMNGYIPHIGLGPNLGDFEIIEVTFSVTNGSDTDVKIGTSAGDVVDSVFEAIDKIIDSESPESLKNLSNFNVTSEGAKVYTYIDYNDNHFYMLRPNDSATIHLFCAVSSTWKTLNIRYQHLGNLSFVLPHN